MSGFDPLARLLCRDALMLVIDKPAGLPVHRGPKGGETLTDHLDALRFGLPKRPELVHRLDRDTSGCLVLGRHRKALDRLGKLFASGAVQKTYLAVVEGGPQEEAGEIDFPLVPRDPSPRSWWMKVDPAGLPSLTRWRVLGRTEGPPRLTLLAMEPVTGRTHQLRVHAAAMDWPILGDAIYGHAPKPGSPGFREAPPLHLHARAIEIPLYRNKPPIRVEAPVPAHMRAAVAACGMDVDAGR
jgi:tRNA pseudouridine32 synthase/23S rRNA pseudouridine746 synthase